MNKSFKIFRWILLLLMLIPIANAALDDALIYYSLDDDTVSGATVSDVSGNGLDITNNGATTGITGIIKEGFSFDGSNDYLHRAYISNLAVSNDFSVSMWVFVDSTVGDRTFVTSFTDASNKWYFGIRDAEMTFTTRIGGTFNGKSKTFTSTGVWKHVGFSKDGSTKRLYIDGVLQTGTGTTIMAGAGTAQEFEIGANNVGNDDPYDGNMDEIGVYDRVLSDAEFLELYNGGDGFNPYTETPEIQSDIQDFYNTSSITINVTTETNVNMSYVLDAGIETSICNDCNSSSFNLNSLNDSLHNIILISNDANGETNVSKNFTIDTLNPVIINNIPLESNTYDFDGSWFSCTDINLLSCNVSINGFNEASGINFTLLTNGNISYTITGKDLAGNEDNENGVILINPPQCFNFFDNGVPITIYDFGENSFSNNPACFDTYDDGLVIGNNTLIFEKLGFSTTNISFILNTTSDLNESFNITNSKIVLNIFDRETGLLVQNLSIITLVATVGFNGSTTTGQLNITDINFVLGDYKITVENQDYFTESVFFTYDNQETLNVNVWMLNTNASDAGFIVIEVFTDLQQFVDGAVVKALEWIPSSSSFETRAQAVTNPNGQAILNIEIGTKTYKFSAEDGTNFKTVNEPNGNIVQVNADTIPIQFDAEGEAVGSITDGLFTNVIETNISENITIISFIFSDSNGLVNEGCLNFYRVRGNIRTLLNQTCIQSSTGEIIEQFFTNNSFNLEVEAIVILENEVRSVQTFLYKGTGDISFSLKEYGFDVLVPLIFALIGLGLGLSMRNVYIAIFVLNVLVWVSITIVPSVLSSATALFLSVFGSVIIWGGFKK